MKVNTLKLKDSGYPEILGYIPTPPKQLYWLGAPAGQLLDRPKVAIVGSRKASPYGRRVTQDLAAALARAGILIISGLALGIDSIAHRSALEQGGLTLAVLPTSLDDIYPASHRQLAADILKSDGAIVSEYAAGTEAYRGNFIARNRIVSGLADVLLITEAAAASGTMHTARFALEQGKTVMAVPGNITSPGSEGCNNLIKSGAIPVTGAEDVFFALNIKPEAAKNRLDFRGNQQEEAVLSLIAAGLQAQEELAVAAGLDGAEVGSVLTMLEINGYIKPLGSGNWVAI